MIPMKVISESNDILQIPIWWQQFSFSVRYTKDVTSKRTVNTFCRRLSFRKEQYKCMKDALCSSSKTEMSSQMPITDLALFKAEL